MFSSDSYFEHWTHIQLEHTKRHNRRSSLLERWIQAVFLQIDGKEKDTDECNSDARKKKLLSRSYFLQGRVRLRRFETTSSAFRRVERTPRRSFSSGEGVEGVSEQTSFLSKKGGRESSGWYIFFLLTWVSSKSCVCTYLHIYHLFFSTTVIRCWLCLISILYNSLKITSMYKDMVDLGDRVQNILDWDRRSNCRRIFHSRGQCLSFKLNVMRNKT